MLKKHPAANERGSALITCIVIATLCLSLVLWHTEWSKMRTTSRVHQMTSHTALSYADEAVTHAISRLKSPGLNLFLPINNTTSYTLVMPRGRVDISLSRKHPVDVNLFDIHTTAYYHLPRGTFTDPLTGKRAQMAAINVKSRVSNVGQYLIAVPSYLPIQYGTNASGGIIYARHLDLNPCPPLVPCTTPTQVGSAFYHEIVWPSTAPAFVQFSSNPPYVQRLAHPIDFVRLDPSLRNYYSSLATQPLPPSFDGVVPEPSPAYVYYQPGDLHIGQNGPLVVQGVYIIYASGQVYLHNNIHLADADSWVGILSEGDIVLAKDAPDNLALNAFFLCNGKFKGEPLDGMPSNRSGVNLAIRGGIVSMTGIDIASIWQGVRTYTYHTSDNPHFVLPNFSNTLEYKILAGKYQ